MPTYLVERYLSRAGGLDFSSVSRLARRGADDSCADGTAVSYLGSTLSPEDEMCFCLYDAPSPDAVREANERVGLPIERITVAQVSEQDDAEADPSTAASAD